MPNNNQNQPRNNRSTKPESNNSPAKPVPPPIPASPDQSLASNTSKGINRIPSKPDVSLSSSRTANEGVLNTKK